MPIGWRIQEKIDLKLLIMPVPLILPVCVVVTINLPLNLSSITDSDIDCDKAIVILKALSKHNLAILDLSHCKIGDRGSVTIAKFVTICPLRELYLANNQIGEKGVSSLAYALAQESCTVQKLDLRLNCFADQAGNVLINSLVKHNRSTRTILISGCGLTKSFTIADAIRHQNFLENLDISNNALGEGVGLQLLNALKCNPTIQRLDLRMCKISSSIETDIQHELYKNRKGSEKKFTSEPLEDASWDYELLAEIENALITTEEYDDLSVEIIE